MRCFFVIFLNARGRVETVKQLYNFSTLCPQITVVNGSVAHWLGIEHHATIKGDTILLDL